MPKIIYKEHLKPGMVVVGRDKGNKCWMINGELKKFKITQIIGYDVYRTEVSGTRNEHGHYADGGGGPSNSYCNCSSNAGFDLYEDAPNTPNIINTVKKIIMPFIDELRKIGNSELENFLIDQGLEDPKGKPTEDGLKAMAEILYEENRQKLLDKAQKILDKQKAQAAK